MARAELINLLCHLFDHSHDIIPVIVSRGPAKPLRVFLLPEPLHIRCGAFLDILVSVIHTLLIQGI